MAKYLILFALAAIGSLAITPLVTRLATRIGALDYPGERRVHTSPVPRLGGLAIYLSILFAVAAAWIVDASVLDAWKGQGAELLGLGIAASIILVLGFVDDLRELDAGTKLVVQVFAALVLVASGFEIQKVFGVHLGWWGLPLTLLWVVGITNAFNLIDGLDGLAAGIALIVSATLLSVALISGRITEAIAFALLAGALTGFLRYNFHPARIFLGDSGSLLLGFLLAAISIRMSSRLSATVAILVPLLALGLPLVDTALTVMRRLLRRLQVARRDETRTRYEFLLVGGSPLFTADRRHIHHRLLDLGLTHRNAVLALYAVSVVFGLGAFFLVAGREPNQALLLASFGIAGVIGVRSLNYGEIHLLRNGALLPLFDSSLFNSRFFDVFRDLLFILLAQIATLFLWAQGSPTVAQWEAFGASLPLVTFVQLGAFVACGLYRVTSRYTGVADAVRIVKAVAAASAGSMATYLLITGGSTPPIGVVLLDGYILLTLVMGVRVAFRVVNHASRAGRSSTARRVLLYGAGEAGVAALQELDTNPLLEMQPIGFMDDDPDRRGQLLRGHTIYGPEDLERLLTSGAFDEMVITSRKIRPERLRSLGERCVAAGVSVRRFSMHWGEVPNEELVGRVEPPAERDDRRTEVPRLATG